MHVSGVFSSTGYLSKSFKNCQNWKVRMIYIRRIVGEEILNALFHQCYTNWFKEQVIDSFTNKMGDN